MKFSHSLERRAFSFALVLHLLVVLVLVVRFHPSNELMNTDVIQAVAVPTPDLHSANPQPQISSPPEPTQAKEEKAEEKVVQPMPAPKPEPLVQPEVKPKPITKIATPAPVPSVQPALTSSSPNVNNAVTQDIERYRTLIAATIGRYWLVPSNLDPKLTTILSVRVAPGGFVLDVQVAQSSGSNELDQSAMLAVNKASPLPVPRGELFDQFRELRLTVRPEGIISQT